jgi:seryl-tRNA synthetase
MKAAISRFCLKAAIWAVFLLSCGQAVSLQSLADLARKEAERRKLLEQQGIEGIVIDSDRDLKRLAAKGSLSLSTQTSQKQPSKQTAPPKSQKSLSAIHTKLEKLDNSIGEIEERIRALQERMRSERWALPKTGRISKNTGADDSQNRLQRQIDELQMKLKSFRQERAKTYEAGKKDGFLPGELEGKGIVP